MFACNGQTSSSNTIQRIQIPESWLGSRFVALCLGAKLGGDFSRNAIRQELANSYGGVGTREERDASVDGD